MPVMPRNSVSFAFVRGFTTAYHTSRQASVIGVKERSPLVLLLMVTATLVASGWCTCIVIS